MTNVKPTIYKSRYMETPLNATRPYELYIIMFIIEVKKFYIFSK